MLHFALVKFLVGRDSRRTYLRGIVSIFRRKGLMVGVKPAVCWIVPKPDIRTGATYERAREYVDTALVGE